MYDSDGNGSEDSLPASSVSDSSTTDYDDSDDEPLMPRLSKWKVTQQSRTPVRPPTTSSRRESVSSDDSDAYVPSSTTNSDDSDGGQSQPTVNSSNISQSRGNRSSSSSDDDEPLVTMFPKWKAAQQSRPAANPLTASRQSVPSSSSDEEDDTPPPWRPVLRRQVRMSDGTIRTRRRPVILETSNSDYERDM